MSHFTVGVFLKEGEKTLEELLAPYQENNMNDCPKEYLEFEECDKSYIEEYEDHKDEYDTLEEFMYEYHGYSLDEETGKFGYWENPNAKWDWYEVGGRWEGNLLNKNGENVNYCRLKDIDWETMVKDRRKEAEKTFDTTEGKLRIFRGIEKDDTKESYVERESEFATYAVITPDGKWHSKGMMGWFGCSTESDDSKKTWNKSFYNSFVKCADKDLILVIVDCHI